ncbi:hypothetical protein BDR05DRAFT_989252 [Suillus weaverae]|nr:hypothetical protein BDR05DRAFT_989252 [Suillus weaverae]
MQIPDLFRFVVPPFQPRGVVVLLLRHAYNHQAYFAPSEESKVRKAVENLNLVRSLSNLSVRSSPVPCDMIKHAISPSPMSAVIVEVDDARVKSWEELCHIPDSHVTYRKFKDDKSDKNFYKVTGKRKMEPAESGPRPGVSAALRQATAVQTFKSVTLFVQLEPRRPRVSWWNVYNVNKVRARPHLSRAFIENAPTSVQIPIEARPPVQRNQDKTLGPDVRWPERYHQNAQRQDCCSKKYRLRSTSPDELSWL